MVPLLSRVLSKNLRPRTGNLYLAAGQVLALKQAQKLRVLHPNLASEDHQPANGIDRVLLAQFEVALARAYLLVHVLQQRREKTVLVDIVVVEQVFVDACAQRDLAGWW